MKNSEIGAGSKANHLSYLGDTTVGSKVNVGAGTVGLRNYDGANKHRTTIGDGAFIGSGTMLVAPVSIGEDATIGAGIDDHEARTGRKAARSSAAAS